MPTTFTHNFDTPVYKGSVSFPTGLFIGGKWCDGVNGTTIDIVNPATGKLLTTVSEATVKDVDLAVIAAQKAFDTTWGLNAPGSFRGALLHKLAAAIEAHQDELAALESLNNGKSFSHSRNADVAMSIDVLKYYAGWADKITGQTLETDENKFAYTRHEPIGVCGQIIPWNFPLLMFAWKLGPALATGNTVVLKPSELTPLTALRVCSLIKETGFPDGVVNVVTGYGPTAGAAISEHMGIDKVAFTGSGLVGRKIMEAAAKSNLKDVTLELGGKSPNIIFDDADLDEALNWTMHGLYFNHGQVCCAGTRIFVQESVYDEFLAKFTERSKKIKIGDPFGEGVYQGPQVSKTQFDRIMAYIESGKADGAKVQLGGNRVGDEGYFIEPTIFTETSPGMKIVKEEVFGPVGVFIKFKDEDEVVRLANDTTYGLACGLFTQNIKRAIRIAHQIKAGTAWVNIFNHFNVNTPFGGYKQSGIGRECGEYALKHYTNVKAVHVNLGHTI